MALRTGVGRFVYVSVVHGARLRHLDIVDAHEAFVEELERSGIEYTVVRPTGYFSDMGEIFEMARKGRVWLIGSGTNRVNPIHGADLAVACTDAVESGQHGTELGEIEVGGPQTLTWREVAELAFEVLDRPAKITSVPEWLMWPVVRGLRIFNRHQGELLSFFTTMATLDVVAPARGTHTLEAHFRALREESCNGLRSSSPRTALEPVELLRVGRDVCRQHLECDLAAQRRVACTIDLPHPAGTDQGDEVIVGPGGPVLLRQTERVPHFGQMYPRSSSRRRIPAMWFTTKS